MSTTVPERVWMYWEDMPGRTRPPYLDLCFESIQRQADGLELIVTGRESIFEYAPEIDRATWESLPAPNFRSDYARTRLLHRYGGVWIDYDLIAMRPLRELLQPLVNEEILGWGRENQGRFYAGLFASRPQGEFVTHWMEAQDHALEPLRAGRPLAWAALAQHITEPLAKQFGYWAWPMRKIAPVMWWEWRRFTSGLDSPSRVLSFDPYTVMLFNKVMAPWCGGWSRERILSSPTLLSRLLRIALGLSDTDHEEARRGPFAPVARLRFSPAGRGLEKQFRWRLKGLPRDEV